MKIKASQVTLNKNLTNSINNIKATYKKDIWMCIINALLIEIYFIALNTINKFVKSQFDVYIKAFYMTYIFLAILMFEMAYKKEKRNLVITGIEFILLSIHTLLVGRAITIFDENYIMQTSYIWPIYYCLKSLIIYTNENRKKLKQISDISEIVKEEKPIKKVAKKRKK